MSDHVTEWLGAYHDGELKGARLRQVENHLAECVDCRTALEEMQNLSALLHRTVPNGEFISTERFVSNLNLSLPRQTEQPQTRKALEIGWWLIPVGVLGTWVFLQVTFSLSSLFQVASDAGLLGGSLSWFQGSPVQTEWFSYAMNLFGNQSGIVSGVLSPLNDASLFLQNLAGQYLWQALLAVLYLIWLASWWFRQQRPSENPGIFSRS